MKDTELDNLERNILDIIDHYRGHILDPIEQELGDSPSWKFLRSKILKALGDRGLSGRIREVIQIEKVKWGSK